MEATVHEYIYHKYVALESLHFMCVNFLATPSVFKHTFYQQKLISAWTEGI